MANSMKILQTKKHAQQFVSHQEIFNDALQRYDGDKRRAAEVVLDVATNGMWGVWDEEKINRSIQLVLDKFLQGAEV